MKFDPAQWTYGVEHEWGDVRVGDKLPAGTTWNHNDNTVVNSNGIANDPMGKIYPFGGEINTKPTDTPQGQVDILNEMLASLDPKPAVNYRSNLHVHVRVPGLKDDLESLKQLLGYIHKWMPTLYPKIDPIPYPTTEDYPTKESFDGAMKRYKRRKRSHQYMYPANAFKRMMAATTPQEFYLGETVIGSNGKPAFAIATRAGINLRQIFEETNTIEFRHFTGSLEPHKLLDSIEWCKDFLNLALNFPEVSPLTLLENRKYDFQPFHKYDYTMEKMYERTNFAHNTRAQVAVEIAKLREEGYIQ